VRAYFWYLVCHKWYVFVECCKLGIPWLGIVHDLSKFLPGEFLPCTRVFSRTIGSQAKMGQFEQDDVAFDFAQLLHHRRNKHHWQWWVLLRGNGDIVPLEMPSCYCKEMLADCRGAGRAQRNLGAKEWYGQYKDEIHLYPTTREWLEANL